MPESNDDTPVTGDGGNGQGAAPGGPGPAAPQSAGQPPEAAPGPAAPNDLEAQFAALRAESDDLRNRLLRVSADYQNFVRRSQQGIADARALQTMEICKSLVNVLDSFDHALAVDPEKTGVASLLQGMQMVRDQLLKALEAHGVRRLEVKPGDPFDPVVHEALMNQKVEGLAPNLVAAQLQPGYVLGDKTIRPAKVSVSQ
jgi:molecular chaperone GrpE